MFLDKGVGILYFCAILIMQSAGSTGWHIKIADVSGFMPERRASNGVHFNGGMFGIVISEIGEG